MENNQNKELVLLRDLGNLKPHENAKYMVKFGIYKCGCGKEFKARTPDVKNGKTRSCGCANIQAFRNRCLKINTTHGLANHRLYGTWQGMMRRCYSPTHKPYKDYGGVGITVCSEWHNVTNFINDMSSTFLEGLTLDRIDNNLGYYKENCRWATKSTQSRNQRVLKSSNTSGYRGVSFSKANKKFVAKIMVNPKNIHIGYFATAIEAAKAYDKYVIDNNLEHSRNFS